MKTFALSILTPEKSVFEDQVISLIAPGTLGYLELLINHAPLITSLQAGKLTITDKNQAKMIYAVSGGLLQMHQNEAILLGDAIEAASEIDYQRAIAAYKRARQRIAAHEPGLDLPRAKKAMSRAANRMKVYEQHNSIKPMSPMLEMFD